MATQRRRPIMDGVDLRARVRAVDESIVETWRWALGYDPGWASPFAVASMVQAPDGSICVIRCEEYRRHTIAQVEGKVSLWRDGGFSIIGVDPEAFSHRAQTGLRDVDVMGLITDDIVGDRQSRTRRFAMMRAAFSTPPEVPGVWIDQRATAVLDRLGRATGEGGAQHVFDAVSYGVYALSTTAASPEAMRTLAVGG